MFGREVGLRERRCYEEGCDEEVLPCRERGVGPAKREVVAHQCRYSRSTYENHTDAMQQGMNDEIFPIEDSMIPLQNGSVKEARFIPNSMHMGEPAAGPIIMKWVQEILGGLKEATANGYT